MTKICSLGGSIQGLVQSAVPPACVTFRRWKSFKGMTTRSKETGGLPRLVFRLKLFAHGNILINRHGGLKETRLCGRQHAEMRTIPLIFIRWAHIRVWP